MRALLLVLLLAVPLRAQTLGETEFANSGAPEAQEPFLRGLLLLHSFEYEDAREAFQEAVRLDPEFAMAYWGEAMTHNHPIWMEQDRDAARQALDGLAPSLEERLSLAPTAREKDYLRALHVLYGDGEKEDRDDAYAESMAALAARYPDDLDAAAFHALAILGTAHEGRDFTTYMRAAAVAEEIFDRNPQHPGAAHYLIHAYDDPIHAPLGLRPARVYAGIAPDASHALHMPSHIYVALGMWDEAAEMNQRSFDAARTASARHGDALNGHGWHAIYWQHYAELQRGRYDAARDLLDLARSIAGPEPTGRAAMHYYAMLAQHLVETEDWALREASARELTAPTDAVNLSTEARLRYAEGLHALRNGAPSGLEAQVSHLRQALGEDEEPRVRVTLHQLEGLHALARGEEAEALRHLEEAAALEDDLPLTFGPPFPVKPSHELLGDVLRGLGRDDQAQAHYETALTQAPRRAATLLGLSRAAEAAGDIETAEEARSSLDDVWRDADSGVRGLLTSGSKTR